jgi:hypothetical protein
MATAKKAAKKAPKDSVTAVPKTSAKPSTVTGGVPSRVVPESGNPKDTKRPEIDESRHPDSGMQELPTGGGVDLTASSNAQQGSGIVPSFIDPQPSIGADHGQRDHQDAPVDVNEADRITNYAVAASLPVIEKGQPGYSAHPAKQRAPKKAVPAKGDEPGTPAEADAIESFKDKDRRTMVVVKTAKGWAACPVDPK